MIHGKKAFFAGTGVPNRPGSLQVISYPFWDKVYEVQLHSKPVSRMAFNYENTLLFTASEDGSLAFLTIKDDDKRKKESLPSVSVTNEQIIPKAQRDQIKEEIRSFRQEIDQRKETNTRVLAQTVKEKDSQIQKL